MPIDRSVATYVWTCVGSIAAASIVIAIIDGLPAPLAATPAVADFIGVDVTAEIAGLAGYMGADVRVAVIAWIALVVLLLAEFRTVVLAVGDPWPVVSVVVGSTMWVSVMVVWQTGRLSLVIVGVWLVATAVLALSVAFSRDTPRGRRSRVVDSAQPYEIARTVVLVAGYVVTTLLAAVLHPAMVPVALMLGRRRSVDRRERDGGSGVSI